jgi:hypothetical protein
MPKHFTVFFVHPGGNPNKPRESGVFADSLAQAGQKVIKHWADNGQNVTIVTKPKKKGKR